MRSSKSADYVRTLSTADRKTFTKDSFKAKLVEMLSIIKQWRKEGQRPDGTQWFETKAGFAREHDPAKGIYEWKSPNIMSGNPEYSNLVSRWEKLKSLSQNFKGLRQQNADLEAQLRALREQNVRFLFIVNEMQNEIRRIDPKNSLLQRLALYGIQTRK